jgi:hypothetical protein
MSKSYSYSYGAYSYGDSEGGKVIKKINKKVLCIPMGSKYS